MTKDEAMDLALEALENCYAYLHEDEDIPVAITAIKQARALDKKAENARALGLDYEPVWDNLPSNKDVEDAMQMKRLNQLVTPPAQPAPVQEPVGCEGAIVNGRVYADRLEHDYKFECEAGPLHLCNDWVEFRRCFEWLAVHATPPAQPAPAQSCYCPNCEAMGKELAALKAQPVQEPVAWICNHHEVGVKNDVDYWQDDIDALPVGTPLYTTPPAAQRQWVGLTDVERRILWEKDSDMYGDELTYAMSIEAKLKEKNT
jgi:hypothetical protein